jgi:hypothetical protein
MNFLHSSEVIERTSEAFPLETYQRLITLKSKFDPQNLLPSGFNIPTNGV